MTTDDQTTCCLSKSAQRVEFKSFCIPVESAGARVAFEKFYFEKPDVSFYVYADLTMHLNGTLL